MQIYIKATTHTSKHLHTHMKATTYIYQSNSIHIKATNSSICWCLRKILSVGEPRSGSVTQRATWLASRASLHPSMSWQRRPCPPHHPGAPIQIPGDLPVKPERPSLSGVPHACGMPSSGPLLCQRSIFRRLYSRYSGLGGAPQTDEPFLVRFRSKQVKNELIVFLLRGIMASCPVPVIAPQSSPASENSIQTGRQRTDR